MVYYNVTLINPKVLIGLFTGAVMAFYFCALTMKAVGRAAGAMVEEVRRQFKAHPGIMQRTENQTTLDALRSLLSVLNER